ncbi:MAG: Hsp20/alpha crystallin family protein [Chitinispirillaceae bacterium]|nr:Hsp20/alpha crystallin family protein [Chitinispirillaceae bacterium]
MTTETVLRNRIVPEHSTFTDENHTVFTAEIFLEGVQKSDISLRMRDESFYLSAPSSDATVYEMAHGICHPVDPEKARATFSGGILKFEVPFREPLSPLVDIPIG